MRVMHKSAYHLSDISDSVNQKLEKHNTNSYLELLYLALTQTFPLITTNNNQACKANKFK